MQLETVTRKCIKKILLENVTRNSVAKKLYRKQKVEIRYT